MTPDEPSPQDAPEFDRALGVNDSVPDSRSTVIRGITQNVAPWIAVRFPSAIYTRHSSRA